MHPHCLLHGSKCEKLHVRKENWSIYILWLLSWGGSWKESGDGRVVQTLISPWQKLQRSDSSFIFIFLAMPCSLWDWTPQSRPGIEPVSRQWMCWVLTTGFQGITQISFFKCLSVFKNWDKLKDITVKGYFPWNQRKYLQVMSDNGLIFRIYKGLLSKINLKMGKRLE